MPCRICGKTLYAPMEVLAGVHIKCSAPIIAEAIAKERVRAE